MKRIVPSITIASALAAMSAFAATARADVAHHDIALAECPPEVQATIIDASRGGEIDEVELTRIEDRTLYVAEVDLPGKRDLELYVAGDGRLLEIEEEIAWSELPARVQDTLRLQAGSAGRVDDLARNTAGKTVTFSAEIEISGQPDIDVEVAADGRLLSTVQEHDD